MIALIVGGKDTATRQAFLEECPDALVLDADPTGPSKEVIERLTAAKVSRVIACTPGSTAYARRCMEAIGLFDAAPFFVGVASNHGGAVAGAARRLSVDLVSVDGAHVSAGVYEHRMDWRDGAQRLRHRLSLPPTDKACVDALEFARSSLDRQGFRNGATCVLIDASPTGLHLADVLTAPAVPAAPADAAFAAFGHSHQHLYAESVLRPREFERRSARPLVPGATTLAIAPLWNGKSAAAGGLVGLRLLRRLTGFHCVSAIDSAQAGIGPVAIACFVHADRVSVENSLTILHEYQDSHAFFARDDELIGFAATAA